MKFIERLVAMEVSEKYRRPTEAEWEYATGGGVEKSPGPVFWGQ